MMRKVLPNLFIVGFPKTGTTSIFEILSKQTSICPSKNKEPGDWQELTNFNNAQEDSFNEYLKNFNACKHEKYLMDGSTRYILNTNSAATIKNFSSDAKIIIGLREPLSYISSLCFQIEKNTGKKRYLKQDILDGASYTRPSYYTSVKSFVEEFGTESVMIYLFDDFRSNSEKVINDIYNFLGINTQCNSISIPKNNISIKFKTTIHAKLYDYLVYSRISVLIRSLLRNIGINNFESIKNIFTKKVDYILDLDEDFKNTVKLRFYDDISKLSALIGQDLIGAWGYDNITELTNAHSEGAEGARR